MKKKEIEKKEFSRRPVNRDFAEGSSGRERETKEGESLKPMHRDNLPVQPTINNVRQWSPPQGYAPQSAAPPPQQQQRSGGLRDTLPNLPLLPLNNNKEAAAVTVENEGDKSPVRDLLNVLQWSHYEDCAFRPCAARVKGWSPPQVYAPQFAAPPPQQQQSGGGGYVKECLDDLCCCCRCW